MLSQAMSLGQAHLGNGLGARLVSKARRTCFRKCVLSSVHTDSYGPYSFLSYVWFTKERDMERKMFIYIYIYIILTMIYKSKEGNKIPRQKCNFLRHLKLTNVAAIL